MHSEKQKKIIEYILPALVVGVIFLVVLFLNGLWPFGKETIDYYDMAQQAEAFYFHNYDELYGLKSFVFDWYTNLGRGIPGLSEPSVYDVFLLLFPRDHIPEAMSFLMMIKIMASAFFMGLFIRYVNEKMPYIYRLMLSAGYGLCGFVLINYTIPQWLDMASFVPLVLMFSQISLKKGKILGLSLSVFAVALIDIYFSIQMLMMLFLLGGAFYVSRFLDRKKTGEKTELFTGRFLLGILTGVGLSAFSFIPDIVFSLSSARFDNGSTDSGLIGAYLSILENIQPAYLSRWFALLSLAFPAALAAVGVIRLIRKKQYGSVAFYTICVFMLTSQLVLESIHLILHFGSYVNYPVRNSFMIYAVIAGIAAASYDGTQEKEDSSHRPALWTATGCILAAAAAPLFSKIYSSKTNLTDHDILYFTMGLMALFAVLHFVLITVKGYRTGGISFGLWAAELMIFGIIMIGKPHYATQYGNDPEQEGEYIRIASQLKDGFGDLLETGEKAATKRIKNPDTSLNANYGVVMRRETLSGWTSFATADQITGAATLGYSSQFTRLLDSGGNIFSDTMLHITESVGTEEPDDALFEKTQEIQVVTDHITGTKGTYYLAKNRYELPFAIPVKDSDVLFSAGGDIVDTLNAYAKAFGAKETIAYYPENEKNEKDEKGHKIVTLEISARGKCSLYLEGECVDCEYKNTKISVNGKTVLIPSIKETDNDLFPAHFNNNSVPLGSFENETVTVTIDTYTGISDDTVGTDVYAIDTDALALLCEDMPDGICVSSGRRSLEIKTDELPDGYEGLLVPVPYADGWTVKVNGSDEKITPVGGLFMFVPIKDGNNTVYLSYFPPYMKAGFVIAFISAAAVILFTLNDRKRKISPVKADGILAGLYATAFAALFVVIYAIPVIYAAIHI